MPVEVLESLATELPGDWMWLPPPPQRLNGEGRDPTAIPVIQAELLSNLDELAANIRALSEVDGGIGHNSRDEDLPLTREEQEEALAAISAVRTLAGAAPLDEGVKTAWDAIRPLVEKLTAWLGRKLDILLDEGLKSVGKSLGSIALAWVVLKLFHGTDVISQLIEMLAKLR